MNTVKKLSTTLIYLLAWVGLLLWFWLGVDGGDAMGYSLVAFYLVLPLLTLADSFRGGLRNSKRLWVLPPLHGAMAILLEGATFGLAHRLAFGAGSHPAYGLGAVLMGLSLLGVLLGAGIRRARKG